MRVWRAIGTGVLILVLGACVARGAEPRADTSAQQAVPTTEIARGGSIVIYDAWSRPTLASAGEHTTHGGSDDAARSGQGAVYLLIRNTGDQPERLLSASAARSERVSLHETRVTNGIAEMLSLPEGLDIPPGTTVALQPGGLHLMLENVREPLKAQERYTLTLVFKSGVSLDVPVLVRAI